MKKTAEIISSEKDGIKMDYAVFGNGKKTLIILPGLSLKKVTPNVKSLERLFSAFTEKYTVYVFDRRSNSEIGYTVKAMAEDTVKIIKCIGIEKADFYGTSQGGMIAQCIAISHPETVNKLVLASTLSRGNETSEKVTSNWVKLAKEGKVQELIEDMTDKIYSENTLNKLRNVIIALNKNISEEETEKFIINASACFGFDVYSELDKIKAPLLVLGSKGDQVLTGEASLEIAEKLNCRLYMYDESFGHAVYDEAADFRDRIYSFLQP